MIRFSEEKVLLLHQLMIAETGGSVELRDIGLLDSALEGIFQTFGGVERLKPENPLQPVRTSRMCAIWSSGKSSMTTC